MKEKKPSWLERYEARQREQVTHSTDIHFTPGVPTEDGWYVVKSERNEYTFCGYKAWSAVEPKPMTQLEKAREEIRILSTVVCIFCLNTGKLCHGYGVFPCPSCNRP